MWVEEKGAVLQVEQVKLSIFVRKKRLAMIMVVLQLIRRFSLETASLAQFLLYVAGSEFPCWGKCV